MGNVEFINKISINVVDSCKKNNLLPSPSIAQAIIESNYGESELAKNANALFGIKADKRWNGKTYSKITKEYVDGKYIDVTASFRAYDSWSESIEDHTIFLIANTRYSNLIGVTDYEEYCKLIKQDGYATSPTYSETLINTIKLYDLTKYDVMEVSSNENNFKQIKFNVHAGHNPSGKVACGSIGYLNESDENRVICSGLVEKINNSGNIAYDCTCNDGTSQKDVLKKIVAKCNANNVDYDISIHFNALKKEESDGVTKGVEAWIHPNNKGKEVENVAKNICKCISSLGFTNRGVKYSDTLYVLKNTKAPAMLIECCFVDDKDDFLLYDSDKMINAIFNGLNIVENKKIEDELYYVVVGVYKNKLNAESFQHILAENGYLMNDEKNLIKGIVTQVVKKED